MPATNKTCMIKTKGKRAQALFALRMAPHWVVLLYSFQTAKGLDFLLSEVHTFCIIVVKKFGGFKYFL